MRFLLFLCLIPLCWSCQNSEPRTLRVAATPVPHAEILKAIEPELNKRGVKLRIIEVDDYSSANRLLAEGQIDANFFQHRPFLKQQEEQFGYEFEELVAVHVEPLGIYSKKFSSLKGIPPRRIVAIPSDPSNQARALFLLQDVGLLTLKDVKLPTIHTIAQNPHELRLRELDAPFLARTLKDVDFAVIPSNFAIQASLNPKQDALALEDNDTQYVNIIVIRKGDHREKLEVLKYVVHSVDLKQILKEKYHGALVPAK